MSKYGRKCSKFDDLIPKILRGTIHAIIVYLSNCRIHLGHRNPKLYSNLKWKICSKIQVEIHFQSGTFKTIRSSVLDIFPSLTIGGGIVGNLKACILRVKAIFLKSYVNNLIMYFYGQKTRSDMDTQGEDSV